MKIIEKGIIIDRFTYSETSLIVKIFTEAHGVKSYLYLGGRKKKNAAVQPCSIIQFSSYQKNDNQLAKMTDVFNINPLQSIPFHPVKSGLAFFQAELLTYVLHENVPDKPLFDFLCEELLFLDTEKEISMYPIYWLLELTIHLGIQPQKNSEDCTYFDVENGILQTTPPTNLSYLTGKEVLLLSRFLSLSKKSLLEQHSSKQERSVIFQQLMHYLSFHIPNLRTLKSISVIQAIWE
ncbi:MAG: DNA repair protein RecO [Crocinitomicaceae bacterium]|nr:DNA repair protein RecO [Crocinitomicaceae bacterium]